MWVAAYKQNEIPVTNQCFDATGEENLLRRLLDKLMDAKKSRSVIFLNQSV